jgi:hypothetical protein
MGVLLDLPLTTKTSFGVEFGYAQGFSTGESFSDIRDGAVFVGLTFTPFRRSRQK